MRHPFRNDGRRTGLWLVAALLVAAAAVGYVARRDPGLAPTPAAEAMLELTAADIAVARGGDVGRVLRANGSLRAQSQTVVRAKVAGEIVEAQWKEGDRVAEGQVLARLDDSEYQSRVKERSAALEAARSQSELAEATRKKNQDLLARGFISSLAYDNARGGAEVAAAQLRQQEALLELAKKALADTQVRSPIAGWIAERAVQRGDKTGVDGKLFALVDLRRLELEALVPASQSAQLAVGQRFVSRVEGYGQRSFSGRVARIGPSTQTGNRYLPIYIEIDNADASLRAGLFAEGLLQLGRARATALIPDTAVRSESGANFVYVIEGDRLLRRPVELGVANEAEGVVDVVRGLAPGDRLIAANLGALKDRVRIRLVAGGK